MCCFPCSKVNKVLADLQVEVENFILRMAAEFPLRLIFQINNYDMMLAVLMVSIQKKPRSVWHESGFQMSIESNR